MIFGLKRIGIPKDTLKKLIDSLDADEDGFVTVGEAWDALKHYAKAAKASLKPSMIRGRKE